MGRNNDGNAGGVLAEVAQQIQQLRVVSRGAQSMIHAAGAGGEVVPDTICRLSAADLQAITENSETLNDIMQAALRGLPRCQWSLYLGSRARMAHQQITALLRSRVGSEHSVAYTQESGRAFIPFVVLFLYGEQWETVEMLLEALSPDLGRQLSAKG